MILASKLQRFQLHGNMKNLCCQRVCTHKCIQSTGLGVSLGENKPTLQHLPTHFYVCIIIRPLCKEAWQKFMSAALWIFFLVQPPSPSSLLCPERKPVKAIKECYCLRSLLGMSTQLLLFCVSLGGVWLLLSIVIFQGGPLKCSLLVGQRPVRAVVSFLLCGRNAFCRSSDVLPCT